MGIDNSSGVAKAYDFERVNSLLVSKAAALQRAENKLIELVLRWHGLDEFDAEESTPLVVYPINFDTRSLYDELDISAQIEAITAPIELKRYQLQQVAAKLYPFMAEKDRQRLTTAIEQMDDSLTSLVQSNFSGASAAETPTQNADPVAQNNGTDSGTAD